MRIVQFELTNKPSSVRLGVLIANKIRDVTCIEGTPNTLVKCLMRDDNNLETLKRIVSKETKVYSMAEVKLLAPVTRPDKILCVGLNYCDYFDEKKLPYPENPMIFSKFSSTIIGPSDNIIKPACSEVVDWEVELVVVIGKEAKNVSVGDAYNYVFGYTVGQDLTARDWLGQKNQGQMLLAKTMDTFCPLGPCIVTRDEIKDPHNLILKTWVNGVLKQDGHTSGMIHKVDKLISYISSVMTLYPGDIIMTGTPAGGGYAKNPPESLQCGDLLESEIEGIGMISNQVI